MLPKVALPPTVPFTNQLTAVFVAPATVAVNCCDCPTCKVVLLGETVITILDRRTILTAALADTSVNFVQWQVTVTGSLGTTSGAL